MPISLSGSLLLTGSSTLTGTLTAQTLVVQTITSSIVNMTGSNIFGSTLSNTQTFTGSLNVTGSTHFIYGNVGIGTTPADIFHVQKSSTGNFDVYLDNPNTTAGNGARLIFRTTDSGGTNVLNAGGIRTVFNSRGASTVDNDIIIGTRGGDWVYVKNSGNVGIGTSTPTDNIIGSGVSLDISSTTGGAVKLHYAPSSTYGELSLYKGSNGSYIDSAGAATLANNDLIFRTGGTSSNFGVTERMRITSGGNIQISTNNVALVQKNAAGTGTIGLMRVGSDDKLQIGDGGTANPSVVYIPNGNVGIGISSPSYILDVQTSAVTQARFRGSSTDAAIIRLENSTSTQTYGIGAAGSANLGGAPNNSFYIRDETANAVRLAITSGGTVLVGGASSTGAYDFSLGNATANTYYQVRSTNTNSLYGADTRGTWLGNLSSKEIYANGSNFDPGVDNSTTLGTSSYRWSVVYAVNGSIQTSDERQKTNINTSDLGLDFINKLNPVSYKWKIGGNDVEYSSVEDENGNLTPTSVATPKPGVRTHYGLIAQQVKEVLGDKDFGGFVHDTETDIMSLRYDQFISPLIKAIQELTARVQELENK